jgi:hypothetical protein
MTEAEPASVTRDELADVAASFPAFCIWQSVTAYRSRYIAQSLSLNTHPHTVITHDLDELIAALTANQP